MSLHLTNDEPPGDADWRLYLDQPPQQRDCLLELWRREWGAETHFARRCDLHPAFNIANLYWRYAA